MDPWPGRAGAVHRAGRARDAPGFRQRPARAGVRPQQPRARRHHPVPGAGRVAALALGPDHGRGGRSAGGGRRAQRHRAVPDTAQRLAPARDLHPGRPAVIFHCCDQNRRAAGGAPAALNGIDWLEVLDLDAPLGSPRQRTLLVRLLKPVPAGLTREQVVLEGGERIRRIEVQWIGVASAPPAEANAAEQALFSALAEADHVLLVRTDSAGDFSRYTLRLTQDPATPTPLPDFDPRLSEIEFRFKVECPSAFDCRTPPGCTEPAKPPPDINYIARGYESLRRLVIDRLARNMPGWRDRSPADLATTLAELIAYVGDLQHYQLDAVATEAYLHTARRRSSLRRHALLVDYAVHEGCNARAWLHFDVSGGPFPLPDDLRCYTRVAGVPPRIVPDSPAERAALQARPLVFEPLHGATLREAHNSFEFHTWGDTRRCLPRGATRATLRGHWPELQAGGR